MPIPDADHTASVPPCAIHPAQTAFDMLAKCGVASPAGDIRTRVGDQQPDKRPEPDPRQPGLPGMEGY